tara:strand:- start:3025 stop:3318 length:294 start_codon:yes stop_codon:yes gene_type:complete
MEIMSERKIPKIKYLDKLSPVDTAVIEIQEGKYKGVQYFYQKVDLKDVENFKLKFEYNIIEGKVNLPEDEEDFINTIGDILTEIVSQKIEHNLEKDL